jgi:hypothetical protein
VRPEAIPVAPPAASNQEGGTAAVPASNVGWCCPRAQSPRERLGLGDSNYLSPRYSRWRATLWGPYGFHRKIRLPPPLAAKG